MAFAWPLRVEHRKLRLETVDIASQRDPSAAELAFAIFDLAVSSATVPGISAAIADKDGIIWAKGFGWADLENRVPMATETKMRVGSVAKPLTAAWKYSRTTRSNSYPEVNLIIQLMPGRSSARLLKGPMAIVISRRLCSRKFLSHLA